MVPSYIGPKKGKEIYMKLFVFGSGCYQLDLQVEHLSYLLGSIANRTQQPLLQYLDFIS